MKTNIVDLELFDKWLDKYLYVRPKYRRKAIINCYKRLYKQDKSILDFENALERMGWCDITINNISKYVMNAEYRNKENKKYE